MDLRFKNLQIKFRKLADLTGVIYAAWWHRSGTWETYNGVQI